MNRRAGIMGNPAAVGSLEGKQKINTCRKFSLKLCQRSRNFANSRTFLGRETYEVSSHNK